MTKKARPDGLRAGLLVSVAGSTHHIDDTAGLRLDEHRAHSIYIDRYPLGREATISWGGPELIFTNDWDASLLMRLIATDTEITVRFYSTSFGRRVATQTTVDEPIGSGLVVRYTRRVFQNERLVRDEVFTTRYTG